MCDTRIYIMMFRDSKYYTYKSTDQNWPPPEEEKPSTDYEDPELEPSFEYSIYRPESLESGQPRGN